MNTSRRWSWVLGAGLAVLAGCAPPKPVETARPKVLEMKSVPDGHFLAHLELRGQKPALNFKVQNGVARCVNSSDPKLQGLNGRFEPIGNGVFMISVQNENYRATQFWVFREDGGASIKEIPDRGEQQDVVRVEDDAIAAK